MNSKEYWSKREAEALKHRITDEKEYDKELKKIYDNMLDACQSEINAFYGKYAAKEGISIAEAKKRVSELDIKAYERRAARYVKDKDFSKRANEEMRLYNATMKINRLEMLKANIGLETIAGHDELEKFMSGILKERTEDELKRQAGILGKTVKDNAKTANAIVNGSFKNPKVGNQSTFSDRIWMYQDQMRNDLGKLLQSGLIQGKNPRALTKDLKKYWYGADPKTGGGALYCMERLMRTELARVQTEAQKQSFERNGFDEYEFIANRSCCSHCQDLNGKHFKVDKMMPGENAPPLHPHCRCSTAAYSNRKEYEEWLDNLANGGTTEEWNAQKDKNPLTFSSKRDKISLNKYGFDEIQGKHSIEDDVSAANPNYRSGKEWRINCQRCVPTYEMRRRGYDVEALPYVTAKDRAYTQWRKIFNGAIWDSSVASNRGAKTQQNIIDKMLGYGDGARAEIYCVWKGASSAHVFAVENVGGKIRFIDPQTGNANCERYFTQMMPSRTMMCRIDQLEPSDLIKDCCKNKR